MFTPATKPWRFCIAEFRTPAQLARDVELETACEKVAE